MALITGGLVGTAATIVVTSDLERTTEEVRVATRASALMMERVRSTDFDTLLDDFDGSKTSVEDLLGSTYADTGATANVRVEEVDNGSDRWLLYRVTVTVTWEGATGEQDIELVTFVSDRADSSASLSGTETTPSDETSAGGTDSPDSEQRTDPNADSGTDQTTDPTVDSGTQDGGGTDPTTDPTPTEPAPDTSPGNSGKPKTNSKGGKSK